MKITNKHVGWFIVFCIFVICNYFLSITWQLDIPKGMSIFEFIDALPFYLGTTTVAAVLMDFVFTVFFGIVIIRMINDDIKFSFTIPNPFQKVIDVYKERRLYLQDLKDHREALRDVHSQMNTTKSAAKLNFLKEKECKLVEILELKEIIKVENS